MSAIQPDPFPLPNALVRKLGAGEQLQWWLDEARANQFGLAVEVAGAATAEQWRDALGSLQKRHPLLSVSIVGGEDGELAFQHVSDAPIPLRVVGMGSGASFDWACELENALASRFKTAEAPLLRAVLLHGADRAVLILTAHHSISDGISMLWLIRDLMEALSGKPLPPLGVPPTSEQLLERIPEDPPSPVQQQAPTPPGRPLEYAAENARSYITHQCLDAAATSALRRRAREEGTTVHGALCAAAGFALREQSPAWREKAVRVASPVSYRRTLRAGEENAYHVGSGRMNFAPHPALAFWDLARSAKDQISQAPSLQAARMYLQRLEKAMQTTKDVTEFAAMTAAAFASDIVITNLGEIPYAAEFGPLKLEAVWGPALLMGFANLPTLGAATTNGCLRLLLVSDAPGASLLPPMDRFLREACEQQSTEN